ncbi:YALIA101S12e02476g1_1 [Yarrowia lipolytica]|nr:Mitochondrial import inner membrane translocase subunit TIM8 [Yarrowia lipolytica]SEI36554.1 YALIA101S12e02476g1_1 [Yarrowia lipolytica]VBB87967.1 Mitochondrial intermembrane space protein, putative [Yarrowia lipolytica]
MESITPQALESLDQNSRQEIVQFMEAERSKAKIQETVHTFTNLCWNKCIKKVNSAQLDGSEQQCFTDCVGRYLDTNIDIVKIIQQQQ